MNKKIMMGIVLALLSISLVLAAKGNGIIPGKSGHLNLVSKDSSDWSVIEGPWGRLNYGTEEFVFNAHLLTAGAEYSLITYGGWSNIRCLGQGIVNEEGDIHIMGETGILMSDEAAVPVKVWLVPISAANCDANSMVSWTPNQFLFELTE